METIGGILLVTSMLVFFVGLIGFLVPRWVKQLDRNGVILKILLPSIIAFSIGVVLLPKPENAKGQGKTEPQIAQATEEVAVAAEDLEPKKQDVISDNDKATAIFAEMRKKYGGEQPIDYAKDIVSVSVENNKAVATLSNIGNDVAICTAMRTIVGEAGFGVDEVSTNSESGETTSVSKKGETNCDVSEERKQRLCREIAICWGDKHLASATIRCKKQIQRLAQYDYKWTDGFLELKFSRYGWKNKESGIVSYFGDKIQFQNGFGAYLNHVYQCDYDTVNDRVVDAAAEPGRI